MEKMCRLWLIGIAHISRASVAALIKKFGNAEAVYNLSEDEINNIDFLTAEEKECLCRKELYLAKDYLNYISNNDTLFITPEDEQYPTQLFDINDYPQGLFCRGRFIDMNDNLLIGFVGARKCTQYGYECARTIARDVASEGTIIVSGMAMGIDSAAHEGALLAKMPTIAVLGCGVNVIYPPSNRTLMKNIMETGMVISEYPVNTKTSRYTFPQRNRIISGISHAVTVVEANMRSGSLITARLATEHNKTIFAVPGNINSDLSTGTNNLIKNGANLITCAGDITSHFEKQLSVIRTRISSKKCSDNEYSHILEDNNDTAAVITSLLTSEPQTVDELSLKSGIAVNDINMALLVMELSGDVISYPGGRYCLPIK